jgi:hypothetical protein
MSELDKHPGTTIKFTQSMNLFWERDHLVFKILVEKIGENER